MTGLEALQDLRDVQGWNEIEYTKRLDTIEIELKALEIIKNKCVDLEYLKCCENYKQYKTLYSYWNKITKKEYDLLKEVF